MKAHFTSSLRTFCICFALTVPAGVLFAQPKPADPPADSQPDEPPLELKKKPVADKPKEQEPGDQKPADDKPDAKKPVDKPDADQPGDAEPTSPPAQKKADGLDELDPNAGDRDLLEEVIQGMRKSQQLLESREKAREHQAQVVKNLDDLIKELEQQLQNPPPQDEQQQDQPQDEQQKKEQQKKQKQKQKQKMKSKLLAQILREQQRRQMAQGKPQPKPQPGEEGPKKEQAEDTSENKEKQKQAAAEEARRKLSQDVWGHLPPHLRLPLSNLDGEKFLPKYHDLVQQYFEMLAKQSKK